MHRRSKTPELLMIFDFVRYGVLGAPLTVINEFKPPPYGGGNQFLFALIKAWREIGVPVYPNRIGPKTRYILFNSYNFDMKWLRSKAGNKESSNTRRLLHRVDGPIGIYRGQGPELDIEIARINSEIADTTVFQSDFSFRKHIELGLAFKNPEIIHNTVDPYIFHPRGKKSLSERIKSGRKIRIIASAWSNNVRKGVETYRWLDKNLDFTKYEMTFVGRIDATFENIRFISAVPSEPLAELLRESDIYLTASENDPCSNALLEGLACGLPAICLNSGGHPELAGKAGLYFSSAEEIPTLLERMTLNEEVYETYRREINIQSIDNVARAYLALLINRPEARNPSINSVDLGF